MSGHIRPNSHNDLEFEFCTQPGTMTILLPGQPQATSFTLWKLHFHSKGEHLIHGVASPLELHIVHKAREANPFGHTGETREVYAVLGVMVEGGGEEGGKSDKAIRTLIDLIEKAALPELAAAKQSETVAEKLDPNLLVPFDSKTPLTDQPFWRFEGSLTSDREKPNIGYVSWVVLQTKLQVNVVTIEKWKKLKLIHEPRCVQDLNRRFVFFNQGISSANQITSV